VTETIAGLLIVFAFILQTGALVLALNLALRKRAWQRLPAAWAWALTGVGLLLMMMRRTAALPGEAIRLSASGAGDLLIDGLLTLGTSIFLALAVWALFRRLSSIEATSRRQRQELAILYRVGIAITSTLKLDEVLHQIYMQVSQLIPLDAFCIALYDRPTDELRMALIVEGGQVRPAFAIKASESAGLTARVARSRQPLRIGDMATEQEELAAASRKANMPLPRSWLGLPLIAHERLVGVLSAQSGQPHAFTPDDERLLTTIAPQAAIAIENARLYQQAQKKSARV
jgi:K+-sensing histidine kinase KdpD